MLSFIKQHPCTQRRAEPVVSAAPSSPSLLSLRPGSTPKGAPEIIKPHKCPHCSKTWPNTSYLAQHLRIHSGPSPTTVPTARKALPPSLPPPAAHTVRESGGLPAPRPLACPPTPARTHTATACGAGERPRLEERAGTGEEDHARLETPVDIQRSAFVGPEASAEETQ